MLHLLKYSVQTADIVVSYGSCNLVDFFICLFQQIFRVFQANQIQVILETLSLFFLENMAEIAAIHVEQ